MKYLPIKTATVYTLVYYGVTNRDKWCRDIVLTEVRGSYLLYHFRDEEVEGVVPDTRYVLSSQLSTKMSYEGRTLPFMRDAERLRISLDFPEAVGNKVLVWIDREGYFDNSK